MNPGRGHTYSFESAVHVDVGPQLVTLAKVPAVRICMTYSIACRTVLPQDSCSLRGCPTDSFARPPELRADAHFGPPGRRCELEGDAAQLGPVPTLWRAAAGAPGTLARASPGRDSWPAGLPASWPESRSGHCGPEILLEPGRLGFASLPWQAALGSPAVYWM
eukprot:scaffold5988_cov381-Prasinococcus_capsulatus_cf.AAC.2